MEHIRNVFNNIAAEYDAQRQYEEAQKENKIVVFVRDEATRRLTSFSLDYE